MKANINILVFVLFTLMKLGFGAEKGLFEEHSDSQKIRWPGDDKRTIYFVDFGGRELVRASPPFTADRLYLRYELEIEKWVLEKSDSLGRINLEPKEFILPPNPKKKDRRVVLRGDWVGKTKEERLSFTGIKKDKADKSSVFDAFEILKPEGSPPELPPVSYQIARKYRSRSEFEILDVGDAADFVR